MELQDRLHHLIELSGATEREVATLTGLSPQAINFLGSGSRDNPTLKTLNRIAGVFSVSLDWLANGIGKAPAGAEISRAIEEARRAHAAKPPAPSGRADTPVPPDTSRDSITGAGG
ncbi:MAG: helix-turn-helix transcriptional regulator [Deltaproteobacteria bacterium]|nr:helix-turn-helix transcriptional regulator [Myxococcales bacterium]MDP3217292.1 helix-turn-helix transcriptional regulator [Deltaproteobacteria bacterium]